MKYGYNTARMEADIRARQIMYNDRLAKMKEADPSFKYTPLEYEDAKKEVVADLTAQILFGRVDTGSNKLVIDKAAVDKLVAEKPSLAKRIWSALTRFLKKLTGMEDPAITRIEKTRDLFEKALEDARRIKQRNGSQRDGRTQYELLDGQKNTEGSPTASVVDAIDKAEANLGSPSSENSIAQEIRSVNTDEAYLDAVYRGDIETATEMLMEKLSNTEGIVAFKAPHWDAGKNREIARLIKKGSPEAVAEAAADMAPLVPDNAVLIPMPGRTGKVTEVSDTLILAKAIGELTGRPVVAAIEGVERESRYEAKARGDLGPNQSDLGFNKVAKIPEGTVTQISGIIMAAASVVAYILGEAWTDAADAKAQNVVRQPETKPPEDPMEDDGR